MSSSRKDYRSFLLGPSVTPEDSEVTGVKLPSYGQVLRSFIAIKEDLEKDIAHSGKKYVRVAAIKVVDKVKVFYAKARIPTLEENKMVDKVITHYNTMQVINQTYLLLYIIISIFSPLRIF